MREACHLSRMKKPSRHAANPRVSEAFESGDSHVGNARIIELYIAVIPGDAELGAGVFNAISIKLIGRLSIEKLAANTEVVYQAGCQSMGISTREVLTS